MKLTLLVLTLGTAAAQTAADEEKKDGGLILIKSYAKPIVPAYVAVSMALHGVLVITKMCEPSSETVS